MSKYYLGIDTSNYKTSIALIDDNNNVIFERSELLDVKLGERGLRQSDAFFKHSNRLPGYFEDLFNAIDNSNINSIGVSTRPRRVEGSYMPCFLAGVNTARTLAAEMNIPLYQFSHQEGHAASIINTDEPVILFHLSGGTTEFLLCEKDHIGYKTEIIGGTKDISIGQLIDRVGVALNYSFPAGSFLDDIAYNSDSKNSIKEIKCHDAVFNLSGIETQLLREIQAGDTDTEELISYLFYQIALLLYKSAKQLVDKYNICEVYMAGGVSSSKTIRRHILSFKQNDDSKHINTQAFNIIFGEPKLCSDNAIGIAKLCKTQYENK